jgi:hypothetical protein
VFEVFSDNSRPLVQLGVSVKLTGSDAIAAPQPEAGLIADTTQDVANNDM